MTFDAEELAAISQLPEGAQAFLEDEDHPEEQRESALEAWCTMLALEPHLLQPDVGYDSRDELFFAWSIDDGQESMHVSVEEDGVITWNYANEELDLAFTSEQGGNPEHGYQLFVGRFRKKLPVSGKHARISDGPATGTHGFVVGTRAEDGHLLIESRDRIHIVRPEWVR